MIRNPYSKIALRHLEVIIIQKFCKENCGGQYLPTTGGIHLSTIPQPLKVLSIANLPESRKEAAKMSLEFLPVREKESRRKNHLPKLWLREEEYLRCYSAVS